jgi:hypothetical protein
MDVSSRQIIALGAPLMVAYLTWSALGSQAKILKQLTGSAVATAAAAKRPQIDGVARNPFAPASQAASAEALADIVGAARDEEPTEASLHLDGTAIAGNWRMAIINGERVFEGQAYRGRFRLSEVGTDSVTLVAPSGETLRLSLDIARPSAGAARSAVAPGRAVAGAPVAASSGVAPGSPAAAESVAVSAAALERGLAALRGEVEAELLGDRAPSRARSPAK